MEMIPQFIRGRPVRFRHLSDSRLQLDDCKSYGALTVEIEDNIQRERNQGN